MADIETQGEGEGEGAHGVPDSGVWAVIAGGGTAGHLLPGLSVARALVARGHAAESIQFIGAARGPEATLVPEAGFGVTLLPGRGIQRRLSVEAVRAAAGIGMGVAQAVRTLRRLRPKVVVVLGGYASAAAAFAATLLRIPVVVTEQNARAGRVNRLAARVARAVAVPYEGSDLPRAVVTGNPIRPEIIEASRLSKAQARAAMGIPQDRTILAVFSGSLGSRRINEAVRTVASGWADRDDLAIHHVVGRRDWNDGKDWAAPAGALWYRAVPYEDRMGTLLAAADLAVCRSGGSLAELAVLGLPAVLVPLPIATQDHQTANAAQAVHAGAAVLVPDSECTPDRLRLEVEGLLAYPQRLEAMATAARGMARPDAADRVAELVELHARD